MDFLFEPWFLALFGTLFGGILMKAAENFASKAKEVEAKQSPAVVQIGTEPSPVLTEFDCKVYDTHLFEKKLADNGVLERKDITLCDNEECPLCAPERTLRKVDAKVAWQREEIAADPEGWERFQELKRTDKRWMGYTFHDYKFQMKMKEQGKSLEAGTCSVCNAWLPSVSQSMCDECNMVRRRSDEHEFVDSLVNRMKQSSAIVMPGKGMTVEVLRPPEVPEYAHSTDIESGEGHVRRVWSWLDPETGKQMGATQIMTPQFFAEIVKRPVSPIKLRTPQYDTVRK